MDLLKIVETAFYFLAAGVMTYAATMLKELKDSVEKLNIKMAVIVEKVTNHEKTLDKHGVEIENLKLKKQPRRK